MTAGWPHTRGEAARQALKHGASRGQRGAPPATPIPGRLRQRRNRTGTEHLICQTGPNAARKSINTKDGHSIAYDEFVVSRSKDILDQIDRRLGEVYELDAAQLECIVNYDIKFRLGAEERS